ncbi:MAG: HDOD domain-containing protein, partial [Anaerolineaceae bacterium]|nr:HDOD domain-containing protein [Anaerolineaceae bacterium]
MNLTIDQLINEVGELPPFPQAAQKALRLIRNPDTSVKELAKVISVDQSLSGLLLRWANSAWYSLQSRITSVNRAVSIVGMKSVRELILSSATASYLNRPLPGYELRRGDLWRRSLGVAIGAQFIAADRGEDMQEEAYFAGLLCDIGKLAFEKLIRSVDTTSPEWMCTPFLEMERSTFGFDHAQLGAEMARRWNLPDVLVNVIANHHTPGSASDDRYLVSVVHISDAAMTMLGIGVGKDGLRYDFDQDAVKYVGLKDDDLFLVCER